MPNIYCPILTKSLESVQNQTFCLTGQCAWWDHEIGQCVVKVLSYNIGEIAKTLEEMKE